MEITDHDLRLARQGAMSAHRSCRGLLSLNDLVGESNLWMVSHIEKVELWRDQGNHGANKLRNACRQWCLTVIARERKKRSGLMDGDTFYYTVGMLREILPDIFDPDDWSTSTSTTEAGGGRGSSRPSEGNNRLAAIVDVRSAYWGLPDSDRILLADLFQAGGLSYEVLAAVENVHEKTIRRREERVLQKLVERLGGEPPGYHSG